MTMELCRWAFIAWFCFSWLQYVTVTCSERWSYSGDTGPEHWHKFHEDCSGKRQSPIDIQMSQAVHDIDLGAISIDLRSKDLPPSYEVINNGHTVKVVVKSGEFFIRGLPRDYRVAQFHFHWGTGLEGSEHLINGHRFPLEMHLVTFDPSNNQTLMDAATKPNGLAAFSVLFQVSKKENLFLVPLLYSFGDIQRPNHDSGKAIEIQWRQLFPSNMRRYYRYLGSLTTPGCHETVTWTVFEKTQRISQRQLEQFRKLFSSKLDETPIGLNYRPVQPMNHRILWRSFSSTSDDVKHPDEHSKHAWSYDGIIDPYQWARIFPNECSGRRQSPINIIRSDAVYDPNLSDVIIFDRQPTSEEEVRFFIKNNGHTVQINAVDVVYNVMGGELPATYRVAQFHFHWGSFDGHGSEHQLDGVAYPLEMHIVTYDSKRFSTVHEAMTEPNGLAAFSVLFEVAEDDNPALEPVLNSCHLITKAGESRKVTEDITLLFLLPGDTSRYYRYNGSLTTPACYETVIWTVFDEKVKISSKQMKIFRDLKSYEKPGKDQDFYKGEHISETEDSNHIRLLQYATKESKSFNVPLDGYLVDNFRPIQPTNGRIIMKSFFKDKKKHYGYSGKIGPKYWPRLRPQSQCSGQLQSPIDIDWLNAEYDKKLTPFTVIDEPLPLSARYSVINNGHTVKVVLKGNHFVMGGGLPNTYKAAQFHFHWGSSDTIGSEHTVGQNSFPLEMHIVTYDKKYPSLHEAISMPDGVAALSVLFKISETDNHILSTLISVLRDIENPDVQKTTEIKGLTVRSLLPDDLSRFYRYHGSLTTPNCEENVLWSVFAMKGTISKRQLKALRRLKKPVEMRHMTFNDTDKQHMIYYHNDLNGRRENLTKDYLTFGIKATDLFNQSSDESRLGERPEIYHDFLSDNNRPIQALNCRKIYKSFSSECLRIYKVGESWRCLKQPREGKHKSAANTLIFTSLWLPVMNTVTLGFIFIR